MNSRPAVVVGAARGIGAAIARTLAEETWCGPLVLADRDGDEAERLAAELGDGASAVAVDIADPEAVAALVDGTAEAAHVAIAAGIFTPTPALETPPEDFERILAVNLIGVYGVAQGYARAMSQRGGGAIVGLASIAATMPRLRQAAYCASKAGMRQALRVLGMEAIEFGVRINTVSPGPTDTEMMRQLATDHPNIDSLAAGDAMAMRPRIPAGRVGRPQDIAAAVSFLLSPQSEHVVMRDLLVDGGEALGL